MRYSSGYLRLLNVPERYRYGYTILLCALISLIWFVAWYMPTEKNLQKTYQEAKLARNDKDVCSTQQALCKKLADDAEQLQKDVSGMCDSSSVSQHIATLIQCAQDAGLQLVSLRATEQKEHAWYTSSHATFEALGDIAKITQFFTLLTERQLLVQCDDASLVRQHDGTFLLHCVLRSAIPKTESLLEAKSPSTLKKAEGLGG